MSQETYIHNKRQHKLATIEPISQNNHILLSNTSRKEIEKGSMTTSYVTAHSDHIVGQRHRSRAWVRAPSPRPVWITCFTSVVWVLMHYLVLLLYMREFVRHHRALCAVLCVYMVYVYSCVYVVSTNKTMCCGFSSFCLFTTFDGFWLLFVAFH